MNELVDKQSYYVALISFVLSLWITFTLSNEVISSIMAALLTSGLSWGAYITLRMLWLSLKK